MDWAGAKVIRCYLNAASRIIVRGAGTSAALTEVG
ncbi:hypothetical protein J2Y41_003855 [Arthrobacter sp. 1088]|nr:hypothetical protein [Arthrobacter sp. 1088]